MSERTIRRSVWASMLSAFGVMAALSHRNPEVERFVEETKRRKFRNNYTQKADAKIAKVRRWRKRNRIAARSRAMNRA